MSRLVCAYHCLPAWFRVVPSPVQTRRCKKHWCQENFGLFVARCPFNCHTACPVAETDAQGIGDFRCCRQKVNIMSDVMTNRYTDGKEGSNGCRAFPRTVALSAEKEIAVRPRDISEVSRRDEETTTFLCSDDATRVVVFWNSRRLRVDTGGSLSYNYGFNNCRIRSVWEERSNKFPTRIVRRAVLSVQSFSEWLYTLAPEEPASLEVDIGRLAKAVGTAQVVQQTASRTPEEIQHITRIERRNLGPNSIFKEILTGSRVPLDASAVPKQQGTFAKHTADGTPHVAPHNAIWDKLPSWISEPMNLFFDTCSSQAGPACETLMHRSGFTKKKLEGMIFGNVISWRDEPVMPVQIFYLRHGQQEWEGRDTRDFGPHLSEVGESQSVRAGMFIDAMTEGFKNSLAVWSSRLHRSVETSDIIKCLIDDRKGPVPRDIPRLYHNLLGEFIPPYPYRFDGEDDSCASETADRPVPGHTGSSTQAPPPSENAVAILRKEIEADARAMDDGRWLVSSALRGSGILVPHLFGGESPYPSVNLGSSRVALENCRLPQISRAPLSVAGVYVGQAPSQVSVDGRGAVNFIYCGHGNTLRYHLFEEANFPPHFWRHAQLPHGSVMLGGLHHSGKPSLVIADAAYLTNYLPGVSIPYTYSPAVQGGDGLPMKGCSYKDSVSNEQFVSLLREDEWYARSACTGVRYNAPPEVYFREKNILMIRAGHNAVNDCADTGLTELGRLQLTAAGAWLGQFLNSGRVILPPQRWCIAGLTSQRSSIDASLKESITVLKAALEAHLAEDTFDRSLVPNETALFPESLFSPPKTDRELYVVVADDYHLLKYFGACFGVSPSTLRSLFWPHAGYLLVTQTEHAWPEMRVFGNVSYLPPNMITLLPELPVGRTIAEVLDPSQQQEKSQLNVDDSQASSNANELVLQALLPRESTSSSSS